MRSGFAAKNYGAVMRLEEIGAPDSAQALETVLSPMPMRVSSSAHRSYWPTA
jgi:hypothetical protein